MAQFVQKWQLCPLTKNIRLPRIRDMPAHLYHVNVVHVQPGQAFLNRLHGSLSTEVEHFSKGAVVPAHFSVHVVRFTWHVCEDLCT